MRLRAINTRGLRSAGRVSRVEQSTSRPRRCVPIRWHRRDITHTLSSPASFTCALHARCIHRCIEGKRRERYDGGDGGDGGGRRTCQVLTDFFSLLSLSFSFLFCRNESTVGIPLSLSFRWSVRSLILACTPRASQGHSWEGGRNVRTDGRKGRERVSIRADSRFRFQELACVKCDRGLRGVRAIPPRR